MDLIALTVPFFLLAVAIEPVLDRLRGTRFFRANDAVNSLGAGILSTTTGYFTRLLLVARIGAPPDRESNLIQRIRTNS